MLPALTALAVCLLAAARAERRWADPVAAIVIGAIALTAAWFAWTGYTRGVETGAAVTGIALAAVAQGVLPSAGYWALGRSLARRRGWLMALWAGSIVPLGIYLVVLTIVVAGFVACPPDAYECPL
ncbi:MAG: hypothetical protein ACJ768_08685 [Gaiellaceae bacterium]